MVLQNFIVLGIIPGTNIQISFQLWLVVTIVALLAWQGHRILHSKLVAAILLYQALRKQRRIELTTI